MFDDMLNRLVLPALEPFYPNDPFYAGNLLAAAFVGVIVLYRQQKGERSWGAAISAAFDKRIFLHRSALLDYRFVFCNHVLFVLNFGGAVLSADFVAGLICKGLTIVAGPVELAASVSLAATISLSVLLAVVVDAANFSFHLLSHRIPLLWEFHKVHHSAEVLTPITAIRVHPVASLLGAQWIALFVAVPTGVFTYACGGAVPSWTLLGMNAMAFLYYVVLVNHLAHSHVFMMFPPVLRAIFISPALHMIHHSNDPRHYDKNFAFMLTIWDRLAGTLYEPKDESAASLQLGVDPHSMEELATVRGLYLAPLRNALAMFRGDQKRAVMPAE